MSRPLGRSLDRHEWAHSLLVAEHRLSSAYGRPRIGRHTRRRLLKKPAASSYASLSMAFASDDIVEFEQMSDFFSCLRSLCVRSEDNVTFNIIRRGGPLLAS